MEYMTQHFTRAELACRHCGMAEFHPGFLHHLQALRTELGQAFTVLSGARCKAYNDLPADQGGVGGHVRSLHVCDFEQHPGQKGCLAVDIAAADGFFRGQLFAFAWRRGFSIGWNAKRKFLHLDLRQLIALPQQSFDY